MKKILAVLLCGTFFAGTFAFTACGTESKDKDKLIHAPEIPAGINLSAISDEDMIGKIDGFLSACKESDNITLDYYFKSESNYSSVSKNDNTDKETRESNSEVMANMALLRETGKILFDADYKYESGRQVVDTGIDKDSAYYDSSNFSEKFVEPQKIRLRDNVYTATTNEAKRYKNGELNGFSNGLWSYVVDDSQSDEPLESIEEIVDIELFYEKIQDYLDYKTEGDEFFPGELGGDAPSPMEVANIELSYSAEVKANATKLYAKVDYSFNYFNDKNDFNCSYIEKQTVSVYLDVSAELKENDFEEIVISEDEISDILYFPADKAKLKADFFADKQITVAPAGGGNKESVYLNDCYATYRYGDDSGYFNFDADCVNGEIVIPADSYNKFIAELDTRYTDFNQAQISELYLTVSANYEDSVGINSYYCRNVLCFKLI